MVPWRKTLAAGWIKRERSVAWIGWVGGNSPALRQRVGVDPLDPSWFHSSSTTLLRPLCSYKGCLRERWEWAFVSISSSLWLAPVCCCHQLPSQMSFLAKFRGNGKARQFGKSLLRPIWDCHLWCLRSFRGEKAEKRFLVCRWWNAGTVQQSHIYCMKQKWWLGWALSAPQGSRHQVKMNHSLQVAPVFSEPNIVNLLKFAITNGLLPGLLPILAVVWAYSGFPCLFFSVMILLKRLRYLLISKMTFLQPGCSFSVQDFAHLLRALQSQ